MKRLKGELLNANFSKLRQLRKLKSIFMVGRADWGSELFFGLLNGLGPRHCFLEKLNLARNARKRALTSLEPAEQFKIWTSQIRTDLEPG